MCPLPNDETLLMAILKATFEEMACTGQIDPYTIKKLEELSQAGKLDQHASIVKILKGDGIS